METLPECIQREIDVLRKTIDAITKWAPLARELEPILADFPDLNPNPTPFESHFTLYLDVKDMHRVVDLIRRLRAIGIKPTGHDDDADNHRRTYHLAREDIAYCGFCLYCRLPGGEGASCKFVEVGKKEVPVYELKCEGAANG